jgi:DNA (cytosine-5)-methyltransferase 1
VRYLTPTEYERLMGLPEGWTEIGHDGKRISDTARYFGLGNSIAVPCAIHVMKQIAKVLEENSI